MNDDLNPFMTELEDCEVCGGHNTVALIENHEYYIGTDSPAIVPTFVCKECGDESLPTESFLEAQEKLTRDSGTTYKITTLDDTGSKVVICTLN